jgi:hypothetical protein
VSRPKRMLPVLGQAPAPGPAAPDPGAPRAEGDDCTDDCCSDVAAESSAATPTTREANPEAPPSDASQMAWRGPSCLLRGWTAPAARRPSRNE